MARIRRVLMGGFVSLGVFAVAAVANAGDVRPILRANLDAGGDTLFTGVYTNGDTASVKAGSGVTLGGGAVYRPVDGNFILEATIGYKIDLAAGSNGDAKFTRFPVDALAYFRFDQHRFGGGITYHLSPTFSCDIPGNCSSNVTFSNALGYVVQYGYEIESRGGWIIDFGVRYTSISYRPQGGWGSVDGSSVGLFVGAAM